MCGELQRFRFSKVKVCVLVGYEPNEGDSEERDRSWNEMDRVLDIVGNDIDCVF